MAETKLPSTIKFYHEKGNFFRVIHVDGAIGGLTPTRDIFMSLYSQRVAIPRIIEQRVSLEGQVGEEVHREGKDGIFRELEIGVVLTPTTARQIAEWLIKQATLVEQTITPQTEINKRKITQ
ncbi:MAG: hypothetical protein LAO23_08015 [Acidobacteriia bacterium]|nr:hypothetical protein [Terriglobia bacterium]